MTFDASTIFVLAVTLGLVVLLAWAEVRSRRRARTEASPDGTIAAAPAAQVRPAAGQARRK